jgi:hypothetical protein
MRLASTIGAASGALLMRVSDARASWGRFGICIDWCSKAGIGMLSVVVAKTGVAVAAARTAAINNLCMVISPSNFGVRDGAQRVGGGGGVGTGRLGTDGIETGREGTETWLLGFAWLTLALAAEAPELLALPAKAGTAVSETRAAAMMNLRMGVSPSGLGPLRDRVSFRTSRFVRWRETAPRLFRRDFAEHDIVLQMFPVIRASVAAEIGDRRPTRP